MTARRRIGVLDTASPDPVRRALWQLFERSLQDLGHGPDTVLLQYRYAEGHKQNLAADAAWLVGAGVDVLVTAGTPAADAAARTTGTIPIVMATGTALEADFARSPDERAANLTGITDLPPGLSLARLRLLVETLPQAAVFAILADRGNPSSPPAVREIHEAGSALGVATREHWVTEPDGFDGALAAMLADGVAGFVVAPGAMFFAARKSLAELAVAHRLAAVTVRREYCEAGALMSYGAPIEDNYRRAAVYVDKVLRGANPADLAIDAPNEFELTVNIATARALGLTIPQGVLERAKTTGEGS